jgi:hypothetical protein
MHGIRIMAPNGKGSVLICPACSAFELKLAQRFSNATTGINDARNASAVNYIYEINEMMRYWLKQRGVEIALLDLNPAASPVNMVFSMISNAIWTTINREEFNDSAIKGFARIFAQWKKEFQPIYDDSNPTSGYPAILTPPQCLGLLFQRVTLRGDMIGSKIERFYNERIVNIFETNVIPTLIQTGMYPPLRHLWL